MTERCVHNTVRTLQLQRAGRTAMGTSGRAVLISRLIRAGTSGAAERPLVVKVVSADFGYQTADKADLILWTTSFTVLVINDLLKIPTTPAIFWRFWRSTHAAIGRPRTLVWERRREHRVTMATASEVLRKVRTRGHCLRSA